MSRKIIQVATAVAPGDVSVVFALASDGSLWQLRVAPNQEVQQADWIRLPGLPEAALSEDFSRDPLLG